MIQKGTQKQAKKPKSHTCTCDAMTETVHKKTQNVKRRYVYININAFNCTFFKYQCMTPNWIILLLYILQ